MGNIEGASVVGTTVHVSLKLFDTVPISKINKSNVSSIRAYPNKSYRANGMVSDTVTSFIISETRNSILDKGTYRS